MELELEPKLLNPWNIGFKKGALKEKLNKSTLRKRRETTTPKLSPETTFLLIDDEYGNWSGNESFFKSISKEKEHATFHPTRTTFNEWIDRYIKSSVRIWREKQGKGGGGEID